MSQPTTLSTASSSASSSEALQPPSWQHDVQVMSLVGLAHAISHFSHLLLAPMFPVFMREFGLGYVQLGFLVTVFFVVSGVGQAVSGFVVDRFGPKPVMFASLGLFAAAAVVLSQAQGGAMLMMAAVLAGLGNAPFHPVDYTILNQRVSPQRLAPAFSVHGLTGNLGWALAPAFLVTITSWSDWRTAYAAAAGLYALVAALLWWKRDVLFGAQPKAVPQVAASQSTAKPVAHLSVGDVFRLPVVWWSFSFFLFSAATLSAIQSFGPSILREGHHLSVADSSYVLSLYMVAGAVGMALGGWLATRVVDVDRIVCGALLAGVLLLLLCATGGLSTQVLVAALILTGACLGLAGPSRDLLIKRATPKGATGRVYGLVYSGLDSGLALGPVLFGAWMDRQAHGAVWAGAAASLVLAVFMAWRLGAQIKAASPS